MASPFNDYTISNLKSLYTNPVGLVITSSGTNVYVIVEVSDDGVKMMRLRGENDNPRVVYGYINDVSVLVLDRDAEKARSPFRWNYIAGMYPGINTPPQIRSSDE